MESQINLAAIRGLLSRMLSDEVTEAEIKMKELSNNKTQFLPIIESIISSPQQQQWIKTMAASFLNQLFIISLDKDNFMQAQGRIVKIIRSSSVKNTDKRMLQKSIKKCLECSPQTKAQQWLWLIKQCLSKRNLCSTAFMLITCIAQAEIPTYLVAKTITQCYDKILNIQVDFGDVNVINEMLEMWILVIDKLKEYKKARIFLQKMVSSQPFIHLITTVYELSAYEDTIVCLQQNAAEINLLKQNAVELNYKMLEIEVISSELGQADILNLMRYFFPRLANTLRKLAENKALAQQTNSEGLLLNVFQILGLYLRNDVSKLKLEDAIVFQNQFLFTFLTIDQSQIRMFEQQPTKFHELAIDCCQNQNFNIAKTQAAKFLQSLGDWVEESLKYSLNRAIQSINFRLGQPSKYSFEDEKTLEIQTSITIISIYSAQLSKYPEQLQAISKILKNEKIRSLSSLELARIFTLLAYGYVQFFENMEAASGWIIFAINYQGHPTTRYCALDFLCDIFTLYFDQSLLVEIGEMLQTETIEIVWSIVDAIITSHYKFLNDNSFTQIAGQLFQRIQKQFALIKRQEKISTMDLIRCFDIFSSLLKQEKNLQDRNTQRKNFVIELIYPILNYYQKAAQINIGEEVVRIAIQLVEILNVLSPQIAQHTSIIHDEFKTNKIKPTARVYFRYFNQILVKAGFQRDKAQVTDIILMLTFQIYSCMEVISNEKRLRNYPTYRLSISNCLVVLQNAIALFGAQLSNIADFSFFEKVSSACIWLLPQKDINQRTASANIIYSRALNTLFLCHIFETYESMPKYLERFKGQNFYHNYDTKVFIMCIDKQIFKETELKGVILLLHVLQEIVQRSLSKDELIQKNKKMNIKKYTIQRQLKKVEEYDKLLKNIDSPLKTGKSIHLLVTQLFIKLKKANNQIFTALLQALPGKVHNYYDKLLNFSSLQSNQRKQRVYRKVIGIKIDDKPANAKTNKTAGEQDHQSESQLENNLQLKRDRIKYKDIKKRFNRQIRKLQHPDYE